MSMDVIPTRTRPSQLQKIDPIQEFCSSPSILFEGMLFFESEFVTRGRGALN